MPATTLSTVSSIVPVLVALVTLNIVHVGPASVPRRCSGGRGLLAPSVGGNLTTGSLGPLHLDLVAVQLATVHLLDSIFGISAASVFNEGVSEGSLGQPDFVQISKILKFPLYFATIWVRP